MISTLYRILQTETFPLFEEREEKSGEYKSFLDLMLKKASLVLYALALAGLILWIGAQVTGRTQSLGKPVSVKLTRGTFTVLDFLPKSGKAHAIILFGSGDGGWSYFEEEMCYALQDQDFEIVGINFDAYAQADYNLDILQADMRKIAQQMSAPYGAHPPPLILGGWSMGAAQAIAAAGGPHPPPNLVGVLPIDPCSRGRYGLQLSDRTDVIPTGPGTFGVRDFARTLGKLRVAQWHAEKDSIDSRAWLHFVTAPHHEFDFAQTGHYYDNNRTEFLHQLVVSVQWILDSASTPEKILATDTTR
jgi:phosphatidylglycerol lysyltransferase